MSARSAFDHERFAQTPEGAVILRGCEGFPEDAAGFLDVPFGAAAVLGVGSTGRGVAGLTRVAK